MQPTNMQNDFSALILVVVPTKKAIPSVIDVMVIEGPA